MKIFIFATILACLSISVFAQTRISGLISGNTILSMAGSPYIVEGNLLIQSGTTLKINPGVIIKFDKSKAIQIDGELIAIGDSLNHITFTSNSETPAIGDWNRIHFTSSSVGASFDNSGNYLSGSIIEYCDFLYGGGVDYGSILADNSSPFIYKCVVDSSSTYGIYLKKGSLVISYCIITNCMKSGIYCASTDDNNSVYIKNSKISDNYENGIYSEDMYQKSLYILNNEISDNLMGGISVSSIGGSGSGKIFIKENHIKNNTAFQGGGIYIKGGFTVDISCNYITGNNSDDGGAIYLSHGYNPYTIKIDGNRILNNVSNLGDIVYLNFLSYSYSVTVELSNNEIANNTCSQSGVILNIIGNTGSNMIYSIHNNSINHNNGFSAFSFTTFEGSIFNNNFNNNTTYDIVNYNLAGGTKIDAKSNYWHTISQNSVEQRIKDWFEDASLSLVEITPLLIDSAQVIRCNSNIITALGILSESNYETEVYPNPFSDKLFVSVKNTGGKSSITFTVYSIDGQIVSKLNAVTPVNLVFNRNELKSGLYLYTISDSHSVLKRGKLIAK